VLTDNALDRDDPPSPFTRQGDETVYLLRIGADGSVESLP